MAQFCYFSFYSRKILEFCLVHSQRTPPRSAIRRAGRKSSKRSLKAVLLYNCNVLASIPLAHSTKLFESYETLKLVLERIKYHEHEWQICGYLKVIGLLLGLQRGYTKCPSFLFEWDSRARDKHWETVHWPEREQLQPGSKKCGM